MFRKGNERKMQREKVSLQLQYRVVRRHRFQLFERWLLFQPTFEQYFRNRSKFIRVRDKDRIIEFRIKAFRIKAF